MRPIIDKVVKEEFEQRPLESHVYLEKCREYPGEVQYLNECAFISYKSCKADSLMERLTAAAERMPGQNKQQKYCLAILSYVNLGSLYLSVAAQYSLYSILTPETNPQSVEEFIKSSGYPHLASSMDFKILDKMIDDIMQGYKLCGPVNADVDLVGLAESI